MPSFPSALHRLPPAARALLAQVLAAVGVLALVRLGPLAGQPPWLLACGQGLLAALAALALGSARWWLPIHLLFLPAALAASRLELAPGWYLAGFVLLALIYGSSFRTQVPLYLSNHATARAVAGLLPEHRPGRLLDLGSGTGSLVARLAQLRPDIQCTGIESAPLPWLIGRLRCARRPNTHMPRGDFFAADWSDYDVVYAFLSPVPMARVWEKAARELAPGALLISNSFPVPTLRAERVVEVGDRRATRLYLYRVAPRASGRRAARRGK